MSFAAVNDPKVAPKMEEPSVPTKQHYKSYKKKFLKIRHVFKERMRESAKLYDEEQHAMRLARKLQEQNDQLLDLLLDVNESNRLPPSFRYDLRSPTPNASDVPSLEPDIPPRTTEEIEGARSALREAKYEFDVGQINRAEYDEHAAALSAIINAPQIQDAPKSLANLSKITHTELSSVDPIAMPPDLLGESPTGYLTPSREDEILDKLDAFLANASPDAQVIIPRQPRPTDKEREKDAQLHNPVSVYNWLKADKDRQKEKQPYSHDLETDAHASSAHNSEAPHKSKPSPKPPSSSGTTSTKPTRKRASSSLVPKPEPEEEILDEDGTVLRGGAEPAEKKKRKRENDDAYRPKGGSSRARKRTKGSIGAVVKKIEEEEDDGVQAI